MTSPAHLRSLLAAASPRPWKITTDVFSNSGYAVVSTTKHCITAISEDLKDAELIVAAVNALQGHLARIEKLEAEVVRLRYAAQRPSDPSNDTN